MTNILWHKIYLPYIKGIKVFRPLDLIKYVKKEAQDLLINKFGFIPYKQKHFESRFTKFYESYWLYKRFGYDVRRVQFSSLILTKQMTREDALTELENPPYSESNITKEKDFIANKLDISVEQLDDFLNLPKKFYWDYANNSSLIFLGERILNYFGAARRGGSF